MKVAIETVTEDKARQMLGLVEDPKGSIRFPGGERYTAENNATNRHINFRRVERYATAMVSGKWDFDTGESWSFDGKNHIASCAKRALAVVYANYLTRNEEEWCRGIGWNGKPISLPNQVIVTGVGTKAIDSIDTGDPRKIGDVLFRNKALFKSCGISERARLARELGTAVRLAYLRETGQQIAGGENLIHRESVDYLGRNPELEAILFKLHTINTDTKKGISGRLSLGVATACSLLFAYQESTEDELIYSEELETKAIEFWKTFAENLHTSGNTIKAFYDVLTNARIDSTKRLTRDAILLMTIRAMKAWHEDKKLTSRQLVTKLHADKDRFTGLDYSDPIETVEPEIGHVEDEVTDEDE